MIGEYAEEEAYEDDELVGTAGPTNMTQLQIRDKCRDFVREVFCDHLDQVLREDEFEDLAMRVYEAFPEAVRATSEIDGSTTKVRS